MLRAKAAGLDGAIAEPEPLGDAGRRAIAAWNFCDGWQPERLLLFVDRAGADDVAELLDLMDVIREHVQQRRNET